jgi:hypothetical protein
MPRSFLVRSKQANLPENESKIKQENPEIGKNFVMEIILFQQMKYKLFTYFSNWF